MALVAAACGRLRFEARDDAGASGGAPDAPPVACTSFGPWGAPQRIVELATSVFDWGGQITGDGLTLYYNIDGSAYVARRPDRASPFGAALPLGLGTTAFDPSPSTDELELYFDDGQASPCIYVSTRPDTASAWGAGVVTALCPNMTGPFLTADGLTLYYNTVTANPEGVLSVTHRASRSDAFAPGPPIAELMTGIAYGFPALTGDGLQIFFESSNAQGDLYVATRADASSPFGAPTALATFNTASAEGDASVTADGLELFFESNRPGGAGNSDLYHATRTCQ
jgi:hypothetical protein